MHGAVERTEVDVFVVSKLAFFVGYGAYFENTGCLKFVGLVGVQSVFMLGKVEPEVGGWFWNEDFVSAGSN